MMYQGVLGTFFFTVTDAEVATFRDLKQQREIQFAEHKCVSGLPKVQHTGRNLDTLSLTIQLFPLTPLALTVDMRIDALRELAVLGEEVPLVLGLTYYGLYVLKSVEVQHRIFHNGVTMERRNSPEPHGVQLMELTVDMSVPASVEIGATSLRGLAQEIRTALATRKGSVPLDRDFGLSWELIDLPLPEVKASCSSRRLGRGLERMRPAHQVRAVTFDGYVRRG